MSRRVVPVLVTAGLMVGAMACSESKPVEVGAASSASDTSAASAPRAPRSPEPQTAPASGSTSASAPVSEPPPPSAGLPAACSLVSESALAVMGLGPSTSGVATSERTVDAARSVGCRWGPAIPWVIVTLYQGDDGRAALAHARAATDSFIGSGAAGQLTPAPRDIPGIGQDAYLEPFELWVDTGPYVFSVSTGRRQGDKVEDEKMIARDVIEHL